jgi:hypothetical protein
MYHLSHPPIPARRLRSALASLLIFGLLRACAGPAPPSAAGNVPDLSARYDQKDGADLVKDGLGPDSVLTSVFGKDPRYQAAAEMISKMGRCAQDQGIAKWRVYTRKDDPTSAGLVLIVSKTRLTDPQVLLACTQGGPDAPNLSLPSPCQKSYTFTADNEEFYVFYAATREEVCTEFCAALRNCAP